MPLSWSCSISSFTSSMVWGKACLISNTYARTYICFFMKPVYIVWVGLYKWTGLSKALMSLCGLLKINLGGKWQWWGALEQGSLPLYHNCGAPHPWQLPPSSATGADQTVVVLGGAWLNVCGCVGMNRVFIIKRMLLSVALFRQRPWYISIKSTLYYDRFALYTKSSKMFFLGSCQ